jgi:hypothetical protein
MFVIDIPVFPDPALAVPSSASSDIDEDMPQSASSDIDEDMPQRAHQVSMSHLRFMFRMPEFISYRNPRIVLQMHLKKLWMMEMLQVILLQPTKQPTMPVVKMQPAQLW